ncbi:MAG: pyridoxal phosphate-dependent decarboxylase family protein [Chloroflexota bacterium]
MTGSTTDPTLRRAHELAAEYLAQLPDRPVAPPADLGALRATLGGLLPDTGEDPTGVLEALARDVDPGLVASAGPRYFGFVVGGSLPAALGADWLTSAWDQNAGLYVLSPAAAVVEEVVEGWLVDCFGLPPGTSAGFTTGATMANFTALASARHAVLRDRGWDAETRGLFGAPEINVVIGAEAHVTIRVALQMLGLGRDRVITVPADEQGRMRADALAAALTDLDGPTIVCAQAGNVNTGAFDPLPAIAAAVRAHGGWLHVDGAFGLWAAASSTLRPLLEGLDQADSWTTDSHKWLNVPYDSGIVLVRDRAAHQAAMTLGAAYYVESSGAERDPYNWVAESSRRARGFVVYAALRSLGRRGLADQIERACSLARRMAERLATEPGVAILNDVVLNQVLVRFGSDDRGNGATPGAAAAGEAGDQLTRDVIARVQREGTAWLGGTTWHGVSAMRISVSGWSTTEGDADRSVDAILQSLRASRSEIATLAAPVEA